MTHETIIGIMDKLYRARRTLKTVWGENYHARMEMPMRLLKSAAEKDGDNVLIAAIGIGKDFISRHEADAALIIFAAAVDILEPSQ